MKLTRRCSHAPVAALLPRARGKDYVGIALIVAGAAIAVVFSPEQEEQTFTVESLQNFTNTGYIVYLTLVAAFVLCALAWNLVPKRIRGCGPDKPSTVLYAAMAGCMSSLSLTFAGIASRLVATSVAGGNQL